MTDRLSILVVDDTELVRRLLEAFIKAQGHQAVMAVNGLDAIEYCRAHRPDMILMDVMMPDKDGFETTREIRQLLADDWVPIIFLTALADKANTMKGLEVGGDDYLTKPVDLALLAAKIKVLMRIRGMQTRLAEYYTVNEQEQQLAQNVLARLNSNPATLQQHVQQWMRPTTRFSGDVICVETSPKGNIHIMLADSTGHGLTAAICCLPAVSTFTAMTKRGFDINAIAREINDRIHSQLPTGRFVAAVLISVDYFERTLSIWNGGIPCAFFVNAEGVIERRFDSTQPPLGIAADAYFDATLDIYMWERDGQLVIASDGLTEAYNATGTIFGPEGVERAACTAAGAQTIVDAWLKHVQDNGDAFDDASLVVAHCTQANAAQLAKPTAPPRLTHTIAVNWELRLSFNAKQLRAQDCFQALVGWINQLGLEQNHFSALLLILSELFNNALDHGLLGLSSSMKTAEGGFEKYLNLREERLASLDNGEISIGLSRAEGASADQAPKLLLWMHDSGPGFDHGRMDTSTVSEDGGQVHGRGVALISSLCESIHYLGSGNRVEVVFAL